MGRTPTAAERDRVAHLLWREPEAAFTVAVSTTDGEPIVIENAPFTSDGRPMPTLFWLVGPDERESVSALEASGGVRRCEAGLDGDIVAQVHERYRAQRDSHIDPFRTGPRPSGGVGGTRRGIKCLHAHLAWYLAGGDDPVGRWAADEIAIDPARYVRHSGAATGTADVPEGS